MKAKPVKTGPSVWDVVRTDKPYISNSYLSTLKRALTGQPQFFGSEHYLIFGTEHHKRALEPKEERVCLDKNDQLCTDMASSFRKDPRVKEILQGAACEVEYNVSYSVAIVKVILDIDKPLRAWDLKGTSCESEREFVKRSREYDYFRQAALYMAAGKKKEFSFIGQQKTPEPYSFGSEVRYSHPLFFLNVLDYPEYLKEGREELHWLIDVHLTMRKLKEQGLAA